MQIYFMPLAANHDIVYDLPYDVIGVWIEM